MDPRRFFHLAMLLVIAAFAPACSSDPIDPISYAFGTIDDDGKGTSLSDRALTLKSIDPKEGSGGVEVRFTGSGFGSSVGSGGIVFGGVDAELTKWADGEVFAIVPNETDPGAQAVVLTRSDGKTADASFKVIPSITEVSPASGSDGDTITITGANFGASKGSLTIGSLVVDATAWSTKSITAKVPAELAGGEHDVIVSGGGEAAESMIFKVVPRIDTASPVAAAVGETVTLTGVHFGDTASGSQVEIGGKVATVVSWSAGAVVVTVPAGVSVGTSNVVVTVGGQASDAGAFTVAAPTPTLTSVSPTTSFAGTFLTLTGTNFGGSQAAGSVQVAGVNATIVSWSNTQAVATVPASVEAGTVSVSLTRDARQTNSVNIALRPTISSFLPTGAASGSGFEIHGKSFGDAKGIVDSVRIGGSVATIASWSATKIEATIPASLSPGSHNVVVLVNGQPSNVRPIDVLDPSTVAITTIVPDRGPPNTEVEVFGSNLSTEVGNTLTIGGVAPITISKWDPTSIKFLVPGSLSTGSQPIQLTVGGQTSNTVYFTVTSGSGDPVQSAYIDSISPVAGVIGTRFTLTGTSFGAEDAANAVMVDGVTATTVTWSATQIVADIPSSVQTAGILDVKVVKSGVNSNTVNFTVTPSIDSVAPSSVAAGDPITLSGSAFGVTQTSNTLTIGGLAVTASSWTPTTIVVDVPDDLVVGTYPIILVVNGQQAATVFVAVSSTGAPLISDLTPGAGSAGTLVSISGTRFGASQASSTLTLGGVELVWEEWSNSLLTFKLPSTAPAGIYDLEVNVDGQVSNPVPFTVLPSLSAASPTWGLSGDDVTLSGANFGDAQGDGSVLLGGLAVTVSTWSDTSIEVQVPGGLSVGSHTFIVTVGGQSTNALPFWVTQPGLPVLSSVEPESGMVGSTFEVNGANLGATQGGSTFSFGGGTLAPSGWSTTKVTATTPSMATGTHRIELTVGGDTTNQLGYTITSLTSPIATAISPTAGGVGAAVTLTGSKFLTPQGSSTVTVGGTTASVTLWSEDEIQFTIPSVAAGIQDVVVHVNGENSNSLPFTVRPELDAIAPAAGLSGTQITLSGTGLGGTQGSSAVVIGGQTAAIVSWGATAIVATVPSSLAAGDYAVTIEVNGQLTNSLNFSSVGPLTIGSASPNNAAAGTLVTVTGQNFTAGSRLVTLGGKTVTLSSVSDSQFTFVIGDDFEPGTNALTITIGGVSSNAFAYTVVPSITAVSPSAGAPGHSFVVTGTGFGAAQGGSYVDFGGLQAIVTEWSPVSITASVPSGAPLGSAALVVYAGGQPSNSVDFYTVIDPSAPYISGISPAYGPTGTAATLTGDNLGATQGGNSVWMGGSQATISAWAGTSVSIAVPAGLSVGTYSVTAAVGADTTNALDFTVTAPGVPFAGTLSPSVGREGALVTLSGAALGATQGTSTISVGGQLAAVSSWSDTEVVFTVPSGLSAGVQDVVATVAGVQSNAAGFTVRPGIDSISPSSGIAGNTVTLTGTTFGATQGSGTVNIGGVEATVTSWIDTQIEFTVPASIASGDQTVTVEIAGQPSNAVTFTVSSASAPVISSVTPSAGAAGAVVTLTGLRFGTTQGSSTLTLGGNNVTVLAWAQTQLQVEVSSTDLPGTSNFVVTVGGQASTPYAFTVQPVISGLAPGSGPEGTSVTLSGSNFGSATGTVTVGGQAAVVSGWTNSSVTVVIPSGLATGARSVVLMANGQSSNAVSFTVTSSSSGTGPSIASVSPSSAQVGASVTITGSDFGNSTETVTLGGTAAPTTGWVDGSITFTVPSIATGSHDLVVTVGSESSVPFVFNVTSSTSPVIGSISPTSGGPGTQITVTGINFGDTSGSSAITIGGVSVTPDLWRDDEVIFTVPANTGPGTYAIVVSVDGENSNTFVFTVRPVIDVISPSNGVAGASVTLTGSAFENTQGSGTVDIAGVEAAVSSWSNASITFTVPSSVAAGTESVVVHQGGQLSNAVNFTIDSAASPSISGVTPDIVSAGVAVTVTGERFGSSQGSSTLTLGGVSLTPSAWGNTEVTFRVPDEVAAGLQSLVFTVDGQTSNSVDLTVQPSLSGLSPAGGEVGDSITVSGASFGAAQGASTMTVGGIEAVVSAWSATAVTFVIPAVATGAQPVIATVGDQTSNALSLGVAAPGAPVAGSVDPAAGQIGDTITLTGSGFGSNQGGSTITLGGTAVTPSSWTDGQIVFTVPTVATGTHDLIVDVAGTASNPLPFAVTSSTSPWIDRLLPVSAYPDTIVRVEGEKFGGSQGGSTLTLGGASVTAISWTDTALEFQVPATQAGGTYDVVLRVGGENANASGLSVRPFIESLNPVTEIVGAVVRVNGLGFDASQGSSVVTVGPVTAAVTAWAADAIDIRVPNLTAGTYAVSVTVGTQPANSRTLEVLGTLTVSGVSPSSVVAGTVVTISGTNFGDTQGGSTVSIGGATVTVDAWSDGTIVLTVPDSLAPGVQDVEVTVRGVTSNVESLTVAPSLSGVAPLSGAPGSTVTLTGGNFGNTNGTISVGGVNAAVSSWTNAAIEFVVPAGAPSGTQPVQIVAAGQSSNSVDFTVIPSGSTDAYIASVSPTSGQAGDSVTVSGINFGATQGGSTLTLGGTTVTPGSWSATIIVFSVPSIATGTHDVVVTVGGTASNAAFFSVTSSTSPVIGSISPLSGVPGTVVTISGSNFGDNATGATITVGGIDVTPDTWSDDEITFTIPTTLEPGVHDVVIDVGGEDSNTITFTVRPVIDSISPASGVGGNSVSLTGSAFGSAQGSGTVTIGGVSATVNAWTNTSITFVVPSTIAAGNVGVTVNQGGQTSNAVTFDITSASAPAISSLTPSAGGTGTAVRLSGSRFGLTQGTSTLTLGGASVTVVSWSNTSIDVEIGSNAAPGVNGFVVTVDSQASAPANFTVVPTVANISPASGPAGTIVTASGSNFGATAGTVEVGGEIASVISWTNSSVEASVPAGLTLGDHGLVVIAGGQPSNASNFTVTSGGTQPVIGSVSPSSAQVGDSVTITGANFGSSTDTVTIGGTGATVSIWSDTSITVVVPSVSTGTHDLVVTVGAGSSTPVAFNVTSPTSPVIGSINPTSGGPGTQITVSGSNFGGAQGSSTITIDGSPVSPDFWSDDSILFTIPSSYGPGTYEVVVSVGGEDSNSFYFTVRPVIDAISPSNGVAGNSVTLTGSAFENTQGSGTVEIGGVEAAIGSWSNTSISFTVPASVAAGTENVVVYQGGQPSNSVDFTIDSAAAPSIGSVDPSVVSAGVEVTITGARFGSAQGTSTLTLGGVPVTPTSWSNTEVAFRVPADIAGGARALEFTVGGQTSNNVDLTIQPSLSELSPVGGEVGDSITLTGANFGASQGASTIMVGGIEATASAWSTTSVTVTIPTVATGTQSVVVTVGGETSNALSLGVAAPGDPVAGSVDPESGQVGDTITLTGSGFGGAPDTITLGGTAITPDTWSDTEITFTVPSVSTGTHDLVVTVGADSSNPLPFAVTSPTSPWIDRLVPIAAYPGSTVRVEGEKFGATQSDSSITLGGSSVTPTLWTATAIEFTVPSSLTAGSHGIVVTVGGEASNTKTLSLRPNLDSVNPSIGLLGDSVDVVGSGLGTAQNSSAIYFSATSAAVSSWSDASVAVTVPSITFATHDVVAVVNGQYSNRVTFAVDVGSPTIASASPASGFAGEVIALSGTNFGASHFTTSTLTLGGTAITSVTWSNTEVTFALPATVASGSHDVVITVSGSASNAVAFDLRSTVGTPSPTSGSAGTQIALTGTNFGDTQGTSTVTIGGVVVPVVSWSDTAITVEISDAVTAGTQPLVAHMDGVASNSQTLTVEPSIGGLSASAATVGDALTIAGTNFGATQDGSTLTVAGVGIAPSSWSATAVDFTMPAEVTAGTQTISLTVGGQAATTTVTVQPSIAGLSASTVQAGDYVTISGGNFGSVAGGSTILLGGVAQAPVTWTVDAVTFAVANNVASGTQVLTISVGGESASASLTVQPTIASISPSTVVVDDTVTISGANFGSAEGTSTIAVAGMNVAAVSWSQTSLTFTLPNNVTAGTQPVVVTVDGQSSNAYSIQVNPTVSGASPATVTAGNALVLSGANLGSTQGGSAVSIAGISVSPNAWSHTSVSVTIPSSVTAGTQPVELTVSGRTTSTTILVVPTILTVSPSSGGVGTSVTLSGTNFGAAQGASALTLGGVSMAPSAWSAMSIAFSVPSNVTAGTQPVTLTVGGETASTSFKVTPSLSGVSPASATGGQTVTASGANLGSSQGGSTASLAGTALAPTAWSSTSFDFVVPAGVTAGTRTLQAVISGETTSTTLVVLPNITTVAPGAGTSGTSVALTGTNFGDSQGAATLSLGGVSVSPSSWGQTGISFTVPSNVTAGTQTIRLVVEGQVETASFDVAPSISALSPTTASAGQTVIISGANFGDVQPPSTLTVGGLSVGVSAWSHTSVGFTVPTGIAAGDQTVSVTVGGEVTTATLSIAPSILAVNPTNGSSGTVVTLSGANFGSPQGTSELTLGGLAITPTDWYDGAVTFAVPSNVTAGTQAVVVTVNDAVTSSTFDVDPKILSRAPTTVRGGDVVSVTGTNFGQTEGGSTVDVAGVVATAAGWSHTGFDFTVPNDVTAGTQTVTVTVGSRTAVTTVTVEPWITSLNPVTGGSGTLVTVSGTNFGASKSTSTLTLAGTAVPVDSWSQTSLGFTVPTGIAAGDQTLALTVGGATTTATFTVVHGIASVTPQTGAGGTAVTISGANFGPTQGTSTIELGGDVVPVDAWSDATVDFTVPNSVTAGTHTLAVIVNGYSASTTFAVRPFISSGSPASGVDGTNVTLTGTNFGDSQGGSVLRIGGVSVTPSTWSMTSVDFAIPGNVTAGTHAVQLTVGAIESNTATLTIAPTINSVTPATATGGDTVTLSGANFGDSGVGATLTLDGFSVSTSGWSATAIDFAVPASVTAGTRQVALTVGGQTATINLNVVHTLSSVTPSFGEFGATVSLAGTNFGSSQGFATLTLAGLAIAPDSWSATGIDFTVPNNVTAGTQPVALTIAGATRSSSFTVHPSISIVSPVSGGTGTLVDIAGANFGATKGFSTIRLGGINITPATWSHTGIGFNVPNNVTAGTQTIAVTVGGEVTTSTFTVNPAITGVSPATATGGDAVTLTGTNFGATQGGSELTVSGLLVTPSAWGDTSVSFSMPNSVTAGTVPVTLSIGAQLATTSYTVTPSLTSRTPLVGASATTVSLSGTNLGTSQGGSTVTLAGLSLTASLWSSSAVEFQVSDAVTAGTHNILVHVSGQMSNPATFAVDPVLTTLTPASGTVGNVVTIAGTNFGATQGASTLTIGGVVTAPTSWTTTSIDFSVPATVAAGAQPVQLTIGGRTSNTLDFTISPTLDSLTPASGTGGDAVVITGANFGATEATSTVTFGGFVTTPTAWSNTSITITAPSNLAAGSQSVVVTVGGQASNALVFTLQPSISSVSPASGTGGDAVTVAGTNFGATQGSSTLTLGGISVTPTSWADQSIGFVVPNTVQGGLQTLSVTISAEVTTSTFTVSPTLSSLAPSSGAQGATVTLAGTNFGATQGASLVYFGAVSAAVSSWGDTSISATVPSLTAGSYNVGVTVGSQMSNLLTFTVTASSDITTAETLDCDPIDGQIDHYKLTIVGNVTDSGFDGYQANTTGLSTTRWSVAGYVNPRLHHGTSLPAACGTDTADDNVIYVKFDQSGTPDSGNVPDLTGTATTLTFTSSGLRLFSDTGTFGSTAVNESDKAPAFIYLAYGEEDDVDAGEAGVGAGDSLEVRYSESTNIPDLTGVDFDSAFALNNGHDLGAASSITGYTWVTSATFADTLVFWFGDNVPTVAVGDTLTAQGTLITDVPGNNAPALADVVSPAVIGGTFNSGAMGPRVLSAEYHDLDGNGHLDHVKLTFDRVVNDTTFPGYVGRNSINNTTTAWQVAGRTNVSIDTYDAVDAAANDDVIWLTFAEYGGFDTGEKPDLTATLGSAGLRDATSYSCFLNADNTGAGCTDSAKAVLLSTQALEADKAPPVFSKVTGKEGDNNVYITFSENVYGATGSPVCGGGGEIGLSDLSYIDNSLDGASSLTAMGSDVCAAQDGFIIARSGTFLTATDMGVDEIQVSSGTTIYDGAGNAMPATRKKTIQSTTAPYVLGASSFVSGGKFYVRVVFSEPVDPVYALAPTSYTVTEDPANGNCADFASTPLSTIQVSGTVFDLETGTQCGTSTTPNTYYRVAVTSVVDADEGEAITNPKFATTLGTDLVDNTPPFLIEAVAITSLQVRMTYSEPMLQGDAASSAECASTYTVGATCSADVDGGVAGIQTKYSFTPTLGAISLVQETANPSLYVATHQNVQLGSFYTLQAYASNGVAAIPADASGNLLRTQPYNQVTFLGLGSSVDQITDGPVFSDPFVDGSIFSYAFTYGDRVYLGPNDLNNGAFRFEADGANPATITFQGPPVGACPNNPTFGVAGGTTCADLGPNSEVGLVGFNAAVATVGGNEYELLMAGPINNGVRYMYFTEDLDTNLNFDWCDLGNYTGGGNTKSIQTTYAFDNYIYAGISSNHNKQAPIMLRIPLLVSGGILTCPFVGTNLTLGTLGHIGKGATGGAPVNPAGAADVVGIDSVINVRGTTGSINTGINAFYIANNGGVAYSNGMPVDDSSFTMVMTQANLAGYLPSPADDVTLVLDSLQKISPGRKGVPEFLVYQDTFFMARNVAVSQANGIDSNGGELWMCTSGCTTFANWSRVLSTVPGVGSGTGVELANNSSISMLEANGDFLYVGFDNFEDGSRVYRSSGLPTGPGSFTETGRNTDAACVNHTGDTGALGGLCWGYQILSSASIDKSGEDFLYLTAGCTHRTHAVDGGKCDTNGTSGAPNGILEEPPIRVLVQQD